jgi:hypothetical protein
MCLAIEFAGYAVRAFGLLASLPKNVFARHGTPIADNNKKRQENFYDY